MQEHQPKLNQERNLEKDKKLFIEAITSTIIQEMPVEFDESATAKLASNLENSKLFILGEMHGVKENVDIIYTLFKKFGFRQLALEWEPELKDVVRKFIESGDLDFNAIKDSPDGRITAGHFALIKKLTEEGILEKLICFDEGSGRAGWDERDANIANSILSNLSGAPTLVIAGRLHTKTEPIAFDDEPGEHHPMGENIKKQIPNILSGEIEYVSGQYHNYGTQEFDEPPEGEQLLFAKFYLSGDGLFKFVLPEAHIAVVPDPSERI